MSTAKPVGSATAYNPELDKYVDLYGPPIGSCSSSCTECNAQYRTLDLQPIDRLAYAEALSVHEAKTIAKSYADAIKDDFKYLHRMVVVHGNTIINRWRKKSRDKRTKTLQTAFPRMFSTKWNLVHVHYDYADVTWQPMREFRETLLVPWLNLETLRDDPYKLLALLHARTKYSPEQWVAFGNHSMRASWETGALRTEYADCCVVFYGSNYGDITPWNTTKVHQMDIIGFPRGRLILEAQSIILKTLRGTVEDLLLGVDIESSSSKWYMLVDSNFRGASGSIAWSNFSDQAFTAPIFDLDRLLNISRAAFHEAEDHLWLLQTDPVYLQYRAKLARQGWLSKDTGDRFLPNSSWMLCYKAFTTMQRWSWVVDEFEHAQAQRNKFRDNINCGGDLPRKYSLALAYLELLLINLLRQRVKKLGECLPCFKGFSEDYKISDTGSAFSAKLNTDKFPTSKAMFYGDPLHWCIVQMTADPEDANNYDASMLLEFLTDWLNKDTTTAQDKQRLEPQILEILSEFATTYELLAAVRQHRPLFKPTDIDTARIEGRERLAWTGVPDEERLQETECLAEFLKIVELTPFPKGKRDAAWLRKADEVRNNTLALWAHMRTIHASILKKHKFSTEKDYKHDITMLSYDSAPEHLLALKLQRESILQPKKPVQQPIAVDSNWDLTHANEDLSTLNISNRSKEKTKMRPEQQTSSQLEASGVESEDDPSRENPHKPVHIKSSNLPILLRMFPNKVEEYAAKPLDWRTFVTVMDDAGFAAMESGGSAVTFLNTVNGGRIVFHKPHPTAKVEQFMLQAWGKRLGKWFGWTRESFVVT
ncbi:uncharacterized protein EAF02_002461 [Botrytis sinoallii]|uniref:uncharacterized protein n=1 Tax=Botrytis sinoallii TaxID=1463999 RepID=UPI0018FFAF66|nr:uncharacterized protein EAF02_002461 [Botrytis sinoallii]KAF7890046.1 hypothetical protein EAF02_002461 [Botrytis sinoallii]